MPGPSQPTQHEKDLADVRRILFEHQPPYSQQYESWASEHPLMARGAEMGVDFALSEIPFASILRHMPGGRTIGEALQTASKMHDWAGGTPTSEQSYRAGRPGARNPLEWDYPINVTEEGAKENSYFLDMYEKSTANTTGSILINTDKSMKHGTVMEAGGPQIMQDVLKHKDQLGDIFHNMEDLTYTHKDGTEITVPINREGSPPARLIRPQDFYTWRDEMLRRSTAPEMPAILSDVPWSNVKEYMAAGQYQQGPLAGDQQNANGSTK